MRFPYRPEIDGLRAIAVLIVMFFHFGVPGFSGGFVGVDVFFVISGYLITRLIYREIAATGEFRFFDFYVRRMRRLFPALACVLVVSSLSAVVVFSPEHLKGFARELMTAVPSVSNIFYFSESGYFDIDKHFKALLHTWSLGVEEQFYLAWPVFLFLALKLGRKAFLTALIACSVTSLVAAEVWPNRSAAFFLTPFRVFEFGIGAGLVWLEKYAKQGFFAEFAAVGGIAMIGAAAYLLTPDSHFPGILTLVPTLGAALIIYARDAKFVGLLTNNPISVSIGKISYSLYLVHWPLFVFYYYFNYQPLTGLDRLALLATSIALAIALNRLIEEPFRYAKPHPREPGRFVARVVATGMAIIAFGGLIVLGKGWDWRLSPETTRLLASANRQISLEKDCKYRVSQITKDLQARLDRCFFERGSAALVLGDSHAIDLFNALAYNSGTRHVIGLTGGGCRPVNPKPDCYYDELQAFLKTNRGKIDNIVFTQKGSYFLADARHLPVDTDSVRKTVDFVSELERLGFPTVWVGPQWEPNYEVEHLVPVAKPAVGEAFLSNENEHIDDVEFEIRRLLKNAPVPVAYVSKLDAIGKLTQALFIIDNEYTYEDTDHWSAKGEEVFGAMLMQNAVLNRIFHLEPRD
ncbi:MAG TPA: acyltransferase family protein [Pseudaminobacter sp.]|nr:acyltransferase family protein [Pseudaminobacter sp.]